MNNSVPILLAGPVLRRTTREAVYVWLAFDREVVGINGEVYKLEGCRREVVGQAEFGSLAPMVMGERLYVYLLKLVTDRECFENDQLYYYEVIQNSEGASHGFLEVQGGALSFSESAVDLPGFFIPSVHRQVAHASCRKPHAVYEAGKNVVDQFAALDRWCAETANNLTQRPSQLFLTGDQIYADDVSLPMLLLCRKLGEQLLGRHEWLPSIEENESSFDPCNQKEINRKKYCNRKTGFTTGMGRYHLLSFSEYIAMYLLASGGLPGEFLHFEPYEEVKKKISSGIWSALKHCLIGVGVKERYETDIKVLEFFLEQSKHYRRVLANIPTYMMVDDHDITDDWNITEQHVIKSRNIPFTRRVFTNALSAAWVFQLWGNDPARFGHYQFLIESAYTRNNKESMAQLENAFILGESPQWWGFSVPGNPMALVLDTRTRRSFSGNTLSLMHQDAFRQAADLLKGITETRTLILVSPAPLFGFSTIEAFQLGFSFFSAQTIDREPWIANPEAMRCLLRLCAKPEKVEQVVILSGDVHYGFHRYQDYEKKGLRFWKQAHSIGKRVQFWQLTSSACCNIPPGKRIGQRILEVSAGKWGRKLANWFFKKEKARYLKPENVSGFIATDTNIGVVEFDDNGLPKHSFLLLADAHDGKASQWRYNLVQPRFFK